MGLIHLGDQKNNVSWWNNTFQGLINSFPQREIIKSFLSGKLVNKSYHWIEKHPHVIKTPNVSGSIFIKINVTLVMEQTHLLQISLWDLHNDKIWPISHGGFFRGTNVDGKVCIEDTSLREYMPKYIQPMRNRNNITCGSRTCISAMLLHSDLNKWRLSQLTKIDKLCINYASTIYFSMIKDQFHWIQE